MAATTSIPTPSMIAKSQQLLSERSRWASGSRKADGRAFWLMPSSDGTTSYYVAQDGDACTCKSAFYRSLCSHMLAAREAAHEDSLTLGLASEAETDLAVLEILASRPTCRQCGALAGRSGLCVTHLTVLADRLGI